MRAWPIGFDPTKAAAASTPVMQMLRTLKTVRVRRTVAETRYFFGIRGEGQRALQLSDLREVVFVTC